MPRFKNMVQIKGLLSMHDLKSKPKLLGLALLVFIFLALIKLPFWGSSNSDAPLYWVAPMDPNYRRDEPGLSPMGMELVPVYAQDQEAEQVGVVSLKADQIQQLNVQTAKVKTQSIERKLQVAGVIDYDQNQQTRIYPRANGFIDVLFVQSEGESIRQGQPLYSLYSQELVNAQEEVLVALRRGSALMLQAAEDNLRALGLGEASIEKLRQDGAVQQSVVFYAPQDGTIDQLPITEGSFVKPGELIAQISDIKSLWVDLEIPAASAGNLQLGQSIALNSHLYPNRQWQAKIAYIDAALSARNSLKVRAQLQNDDRLLRPNMLVQGQIELAAYKAKLAVPYQSVIRLGQTNRVVLALGDGQFKSVNVTLGQSNDQWVEIISGLKSDEYVVSSAQFLLDSESSKTSDFRRMQKAEPSPSKRPPTWMTAKVKSIDEQARKLRLAHDPIKAWRMPKMTMNFLADPQLDLSQLKPGQSYQFYVHDGDEPLFFISQIKNVSETGLEQTP